MATIKAPHGERAPLCGCGCREEVRWQPGKGWGRYVKGHSGRGRPSPRRGKSPSPEELRRRSESLRAHYAGRRRRDIEPTPGEGVYSTWEYQEARKAILGKPCSRCASTERIHAHHEVPGDDSTLVPLCVVCHAREHQGGPGTIGGTPPTGAEAPRCACGCRQPVTWRPNAGWNTFRKGHGFAKVPAVSKLEPAPLCACGCGLAVKYTFGKGWNRFKQGHSRRAHVRAG